MTQLAQPIYLSGPMSGYEQFNRPAFSEACAQLRALGNEVLSPHEVGEEAGLTWADYIRKDLPLLAQSRSVVVLPNWECSRGSVLEVRIAQALGMTVVPFAVAVGVSRGVPTPAMIEAALNVAPEVLVPVQPYGGVMAPVVSREAVTVMLRAALTAQERVADEG